MGTIVNIGILWYLRLIYVITTISVSEENDPYIDLADKGLVALGESERFYLVNVLPFRELRPTTSYWKFCQYWRSLSTVQYLPKWFPGAGFLRFAEHSRKLSSDMLNIPYAEVKQQIVSFFVASVRNVEMKFLSISSKELRVHRWRGNL